MFRWAGVDVRYERGEEYAAHFWKFAAREDLIPRRRRADDPVDGRSLAIMGQMATYFERMRAGMQVAQQLLLELVPDARFEWGPMDNGANYPFFLVRGGRKLLLYRFSKDSLVAMDDEPHQVKVRELLQQALRSHPRALR